VLILYGLTGGFFAGYLLTRVFLPGVFDRADELEQREEQLQAREREVQETITELDRTLDQIKEIFADLYRYNEQGFRRAIESGESLLGRPGQERNPQLWVYLACARGQAYKWETEHPSSDPAVHERNLQEHRAEALRAVENALTYGPTWKTTLQMAWDPKFPGKTSGEDDLECFYSEKPDDRFYQLLHR
jgi:hypothetical protein